jgi:arabinofuranan 3-O-arabinosyltransferase
MSLTARLGRHSTAASVALLALLAYVPALASSPGRMPADTKLYLYFDPAGLVGRAASTFEPDQFAGWVPHQQITYLWPSGPWFLLFDTIGLPDWIAHRLWIGTIMFLAGVGMSWASRLLGLSALGAVVAAVVYQTSPFILPYVSRTSLLLLPWAGLGWIVALTVRATRPGRSDLETPRWRRRLEPWRDPALIALVVATVGSANATTLAMIVPAPVIWIVHTTWQGQISWRRALGVTVRIAVLCVVVSVWWIAMLVVQGRYGAPVLDYSETLEDVSRNATGSEVVRGLGYWLFYQRDAFGPTTTASIDHLVSLRTIAVSYAVIIVGLIGLAVTSWRQRRFAAMCLAAGAVLAVGVHPLDQPSPLMALLVDEDGSGLALALRSSTRAVPVLLLGVALGAGALLSALPARFALRPGSRPVPALRLAATIGVALLAVANLPSLWNRAFVDPVIDRDQNPPAAWDAAIDALDDTDAAARVLQLPGAEFGAFRWGYTTDPPLVGLTEKPLVTRDLLPLGSAAAMDLLFALDDRFQEGTIEADSLAPVARLLGSDTLWLSNDSAFERFRTARPELVDALVTSEPAGLGTAERFGEPTVNVAEVPMIDPTALVEPAIGRPLSPVALVPVDDPVGVIRGKTSSVVLSGSGDGVVDAAAAGLLSGRELVRYSASLDDAELADALEDADLLIVTDSNRDQARHWRGSQDVRGHTEPGGADIDVLDSTSADQRLDVFPPDPERQTVAVQDGPVRAVASSYGEPFAYRPEDRAVHAIDGDPATAWTVADHGDPIGERIRLDLSGDATGAEAIDTLRLRQPAPAEGGRSIAEVSITVDGGPPLVVALDDSSFDETGQLVTIPTLRGGGSVTIEITGVTPGRFPLAASLGAVGFSEIALGVGSTTEIIRVPSDGLGAVSADTPLALVFTRWRTDPTDPWRSDPEREIARRFELSTDRTFDTAATLRLDRRATDDALAEVLTSAGSVAPPIASTRVTGGVAQRGSAAVDGDPSTKWVSGFDEAVGATLRFDSIGPLGSELVIDQPVGPYSPITGVQLSAGGEALDLAVPAPDASGRSVIALADSFPRTSSAGPIEVVVTDIDERTTIDRRYGDPRTLPVAISELAPGTPRVTTDPAVVVSVDCSPDFLRIDGVPVPVSFETTVGALLEGFPVQARSCSPLELPAGVHDLVASSGVTSSALSVDRVVLSDAPGVLVEAGLVPIEVTRREARARDVTVGPCPDGCWIVLGEGFNDGWEATADGESLGPGQLVDGGFNGWWLAPTTSPTLVEVRWTAQGPVTLGLAISALAVLACVLVAFGAPRARIEPLQRPRLLSDRPAAATRTTVLAAGTLVVAAGVLVAPGWGLGALLVAGTSHLAARRSRRGWRTRVYELAGVGLITVTALGVLWIERRDRPFPNAGWTTSFDHLNGLALFAVLAIAVGAMFATDADRERR